MLDALRRLGPHLLQMLADPPVIWVTLLSREWAQAILDVTNNPMRFMAFALDIGRLKADRKRKLPKSSR